MIRASHGVAVRRVIWVFVVVCSTLGCGPLPAANSPSSAASSTTSTAASVAASTATSAAQEGAVPAPQARRVLRVVLYPFVPAKDELFYRVERTFEESEAGAQIDLQIIDLSANYYNGDKPGAVEKTAADLYELDAVFVADFIEDKKIRTLPADLQPRPDDFIGNSLAPVSRPEGVYGIPRWLCGNFLFSRKGQPALVSPKSLEQVERAVGKGGLLIDLKGTLTLGELYLNAAIGIHGSFALALPGLTAEAVPGSQALGVMKRILARCPFGSCRSDDYHERTGFYARQLARRRAVAYVGYSETLFALGQEVAQSCRAEDRCLSPRDVQVAAMPFGPAVHSVGWTDVLALSTSCTGSCESDARAFLSFYTSDATTLSLLLPPWPSPPRYLLPARKSLYSNAELLKAAPLYPRFLELVSQMEIVTGLGLNRSLRAVGKALEAALPASH